MSTSFQSTTLLDPNHPSDSLNAVTPAVRSGSESKAAFVISLDFELHWGVRDIAPLDAAERRRLLKAREMVSKILSLFREYDVHATWATVGMLFAGSRDEAEFFRPTVLPNYANASLNPYQEHLGSSEEEDPFHFAPSLIREIDATPGQEIASHSYSHYYCLEAGQDAPAFEADIQSAVAIAAGSGYQIKSYVFARNQVNPAYLPLLSRHGIAVYRGVSALEPYKAVDFHEQRRLRHRAARMLDTLVDVYGPQSVDWPSEAQPTCLEPSRYLQRCRTFLVPFRALAVRRMIGQMQSAASQQRIFHIWWHPEDFTTGGDLNLSVLRQVLDAFHELRQRNLMTSFSMNETKIHQPGPALVGKA
jgi:peptidoglycan/xylan/chitin deacetylase (PgdA/CDA1 family)